MPLHKFLTQNVTLPAIGAPLFIISNPKLVIAQCNSGIIGSFPALNARSSHEFDEWLFEIKSNLGENAPAFAVNQIVHKSNKRLEQDLDICIKHKVPIIITSLGARTELNQAVHAYGGIVLHDIINQTFAKKAIEKQADGLIAVAAGAGGHAGRISPFALVQEIRQWFCGPLLLSGAIATGQAILAAQAMGADMAYIGTPFIATHEARACDEYKQAIVKSFASDIIYSDYFTGVHGNYLKQSILNAGLDPDNLPDSDPSNMDFANTDKKAWKDIWGAGQGLGAINKMQSAEDFITQLKKEYALAKQKLV